MQIIFTFLLGASVICCTSVLTLGLIEEKLLTFTRKPKPPSLYLALWRWTPLR